MDWLPDAELGSHSTWTQHAGGARIEGIAGLGWAASLELHRPVLTYEELGRLFDGGPSALYDALSTLLGLEVITQVEKVLAAQLKAAKEAREHADRQRRAFRVALRNSEDDRAAELTRLTNKHSKPLDEIAALVTGSAPAGSPVTSGLTALAELTAPTVTDIGDAASAVRAAVDSVRRTQSRLASQAAARVELLRGALRWHADTGDGPCPVCGGADLDARWSQRAHRDVAEGEASVSAYRQALSALAAARRDAERLVGILAEAPAVRGIDLPALDGYVVARAAAVEVPGDDALADHLESAVLDAADRAVVLQREAAAALADRHDAWTPLAAAVAAWIPAERAAQANDDRLQAATAAQAWTREHAARFRNLRLEPIAAHARRIWAALRQESNVDIAEITLSGANTRRRAELRGSVDGEPTHALSVMSQGEQNAVALALFLPRATSVASPFRFVVLDDPVQAMDPSKIDGFVRVLAEIARTHQVVVFSHDDRLASVVRETAVDARLVEVVRETGSKVSVRPCVDPARRLVGDALAMVQDTALHNDVKRRVAPNLFRMALESAARHRHYARRSAAGAPRTSAEEQWERARTTRTRLALAVLGDSGADVSGWLAAQSRRGRVLRIGNDGAHGTADVSRDDVRDLERTVEEIIGDRR